MDSERPTVLECTRVYTSVDFEPRPVMDRILFEPGAVNVGLPWGILEISSGF